jgi:hypothetical protein
MPAGSKLSTCSRSPPSGAAAAGRRGYQIDFKHGTATDTEIIHLNL